MAASNATSSASHTPSCPTLRQRQPFRSQPKESLDRYRSINALAEAFNAFYKTELTKRCGPWRDVEHLEAATMAYIVWFNHKRLHPEIGDIPPAEFKANYYVHLRIGNTGPTPPAT